MKQFIDPKLIMDRFDEDIICDSGNLFGGDGDDDSGEIKPNGDDT